MNQTPMLKQYEEIKAQYPDCLLFYRLGDFYELFGDDAKIGSEVLHITLTSRAKGDNQLPMCGVPFHASENYIARLVNAGYKVAICEQMTEAGKGLVKREVVRVVTAGTLLRDESLTDSSAKNLLSLVIESKGIGGAAADVSTGQFWAFSFDGNPDELVPMIVSHFAPREVVVPRTVYDNHHLMALIRRNMDVSITCAHDWLIYTKDSEKLLEDHFEVTTLASFNLDKKPRAINAAAALLGYLKYTQKGDVSHITKISDFNFGGHLILDQLTLDHLEIVRTGDGQIKGSLFDCLNQTVAPAGTRLLLEWLIHPITDIKELTARHDAISEFISRPSLLADIRKQLAQVGDIERNVGRLAIGVGSPRDLRRLSDTVEHLATNVLPLIYGAKAKLLRELASPVDSTLKNWTDNARKILLDEVPPTLDDGHVFVTGWHDELDELRGLTSGNKTWLEEFEAAERERTGIPKLKVVYSRAFGYGIEVTKSFRDKVPADYVPRQTLVNGDRFTCQALTDYERQALTAVDKMIALERQLFYAEVAKVVELAAAVSQLAKQVAKLDVLANLAKIAIERKYVRPRLVAERGIEIKDGRHPVVELVSNETFIGNDTKLVPKKSLQLITGPNTAGKSTYIRQVAAIVILAHTGSFVPASEATIGIVDRVFTRIGAHDDLRAGQSTFMVEMLETAHILHNATERSLVILDEVGRGTSPEDGFAIAWAIAEALANELGFVLFATHFHALKDLANHQPTIFNSHLSVAVDAGELIFLRKIADGPADESYGIVIAEKAGLPKAIIHRAVELAGAQERSGSRKISPDQLTLLAAPTESKVEKQLREVNVNDITPLEALELLNEMQKMSS